MDTEDFTCSSLSGTFSVSHECVNEQLPQNTENPTPIQEKIYTKTEKKLLKQIETMNYHHQRVITKLKKEHEKELSVIRKQYDSVLKTATKLKHLIDTKGLRGHKRPVKNTTDE